MADPDALDDIDPDALLTIDEAARRHRVAPGYVQRQIDSGALPVENAGSHRSPRLRVGDVDEHMVKVRAGFAAARVARGW